MTAGARAVDGLLLGVDAGGTRSSAWVADREGRVRARADGGAANYQSVGADAAGRALRDLVARALSAAGGAERDLVASCFGVAGADRPKDYAAIRAFLPVSGAWLVNDCELVLRAGTPDGVGIALVSGTGTNAFGRAPDGRTARVGGLCHELGDFGAAADLGREALRAAMRGRDGRGVETALYDRLCAALSVSPLEDVMDLWMSGDPRAKDLGTLAPVVFEAAAAGDAVARELLERAGAELALSASVLLAKLFAPDGRDGLSEVPVVLGGSVLQRGADPALVATIARDLGGRARPVRVERLLVPPVVGAVLLAHDRASDPSAPRRAFTLSG